MTSRETHVTSQQSKSPVIESTFIKYEYLDNNKDLEQQLNLEQVKNQRLINQLEEEKYNITKMQQELINLKGFNKLLEQDLEYHKIQLNNFNNINKNFIRTIRNLQSYREYVASLISKRSRSNAKILVLIKALKKMQNIIKQKNLVIAQKNRNNQMILQKAAHIIKESYSI